MALKGRRTLAQGAELHLFLMRGSGEGEWMRGAETWGLRPWFWDVWRGGRCVDVGELGRGGVVGILNIIIVYVWVFSYVNGGVENDV